MGKVIVLIVSIVMPREVPDIQHITRMESFETCWGAANEMRSRGAVGLSAACAYQAAPSQRN